MNDASITRVKLKAWGPNVVHEPPCMIERDTL